MPEEALNRCRKETYNVLWQDERVVRQKLDKKWDETFKMVIPTWRNETPSGDYIIGEQLVSILKADVTNNCNSLQ